MKTYVLVGVGGRSVMFTDALSGEFKDRAKLLAICDNKFPTSICILSESNILRAVNWFTRASV